MFLGAALDLAQRLQQTRVQSDPIEHIVVPDVFAPEIYDLLITNPIPDKYLRTLAAMKRTTPGTYDDRSLMVLAPEMPMLPTQMRSLWQEVYNLINNVVAPQMINLFAGTISRRFNQLPKIKTEVLYVRDRRGYALGPHTDSPAKVCTFIIYLAGPGVAGPGTSFYRPRDPKFRCNGGPHYSHVEFDLIETIPYQANLMMGFVKTDHSFHGVEPIVDTVTRNLLICDIQVRN